MDGHRRGFGAHTALFFPAGNLWSVELGRQCRGQALIVPATAPVSMPPEQLHLKVNDPVEQARLNSLLEAVSVEQSTHPALWRRAMQSYTDLISIQLRRQPPSGPLPPPQPHPPPPPPPAPCNRVVT